MPFAIIGHFTHSLTLRDLRRYFDPNATAVNYVPTINRDIKSDTPLLLHAPQFPELDGDTEAMKTLDMVLSHMDDKNWDIKGYTTLERVAHAFHMEAIWAKAKTYFDEMQRSPAPPSPQLCDCVMDVDNNGILKFLRYSALEIREPQLVYSRQLTDFGPNAPPKDYQNYQQGRKKRSVDTGLKNGPQNLLADSNAAGIHLKDEAAWKKWKEEVPSEDMHYNNALFMYCAVQKAHKRH